MHRICLYRPPPLLAEEVEDLATKPSARNLRQNAKKAWWQHDHWRLTAETLRQKKKKEDVDPKVSHLPPTKADLKSCGQEHPTVSQPSTVSVLSNAQGPDRLQCLDCEFSKTSSLHILLIFGWLQAAWRLRQGFLDPFDMQTPIVWVSEALTGMHQRGLQQQF